MVPTLFLIILPSSSSADFPQFRSEIVSSHLFADFLNNPQNLHLHRILQYTIFLDSLQLYCW